jgi:anti-sigma28 factor (negative regulator of flagellin synthesis)
MRIQGPRHPDISRSDSKDHETKASPKAEAAKENGKADVVTLGSSARSLAANNGMKLGTEIQARLELVREQLRNNEYPIDYGKLASNILGDEVARSGESD